SDVKQLAQPDCGLLRPLGVTACHHPRSHAHFPHIQYPWEELQKAGVNLCLGTDSLATVRIERDQPLELDLFAEMREFLRRAPAFSPETLLRLVTVHPARALGREGELGELTPGATADAIAIPFAGPARTAFEAILRHQGPVHASLIGGAWAIQPDHLRTLPGSAPE